MKKINIIRFFLLTGVVTGALAACDYDDAADIALVELGAKQKEFVSEMEGGPIQVDIYSNGSYHIENLDNANWLSFDHMSGNGDGHITVTVDMNEDFRRLAKVALCSDVDERRDTLVFKQLGASVEVLSIENSSIILDGKGGTDSKNSVFTNIPFDRMKVDIAFPEGGPQDWISEISVADADGYVRAISITSEANTDEINPRTAQATISYTDGWGENMSILLNLVQKNSKEGIGRSITLKEAIQGYSLGKTIEEYVIIEGIVVSNPDSGNAGENEQITTSTIDYTGSQRTIYLEALDGSCGVMLQTVTAEDNILKQFDKVQILLYGTTATMYSEPERVTITGLTKSMIVSKVSGSKADVPVKELYMKDIKDSDIYTYVTLKDVEFPVRKGPLLPVNEGYSIGTGAHRLSKYPRLLRDINGDHLYMYTNTVCTYRNDGTRLPYGSGKVSGVVVHERFARFEWRNGADPTEIEDDVTLGNIGRFQIRHQLKGDVWDQMNDSVENSFSALLTEYRWWNPDLENEVCRPTYGTNGWFTHTYQVKYTGTEAKQYTQATYKQHMWGSGNYPYLGPCGNQAAPDWYKAIFDPEHNYGNKNGIGIVIDRDKEYYNTTDKALSELLSWNTDGSLEWCGPNAVSSTAVGDGGINYNGSTSMRGKSNAYGGTFNGWASHYWWDYDTGRPHAWMLNFSTEGISTNHISLQIDVMNTQQNWYSPRFWRAEWSEVDSMDPKDDDKWHTIGDYTIPDVSVWANTLFSSIVGYKTLDFPLPLEILGKPNVFIRLRPTSDVCSDGGDYANDILMNQPNGEAAHASSIDYIAIRYNK